MAPNAFIQLGKNSTEPTEKAGINQCLWTTGANRRQQGQDRRHGIEKGGQPARLFLSTWVALALHVENGDDLVGIGIDDHDLLANQDEVVAAPLGIDIDNLRRQRTDADALARYAGADRDREVHVVDRLHMFVADDGRDLGALLGRELCARAGLANRGAGPIAVLRVHVVVATLATLGLHLVLIALGLGILLGLATLAVLGVLLGLTALAILGVLLGLAALAVPGVLLGLAAFAILSVFLGLATRLLGFGGLVTLAAFRLHVVGRAFGLVLRAHALGLLTGRIFLGALALAGGRRLLGLHARRRRGGLAVLTFRCCAAGGATCRRRCALHLRAALLVATLCIGETRPGDQRKRSGRDQKAVSHNLSPHEFGIARADNSSREERFLRPALGFFLRAPEQNEKGPAPAGPPCLAARSLASAGGLAAAGDADLLLQAIEADGADDDLLADHIARRAVETHVLGKLHVLLDRRLDLGARHVLLDARGIVAGILGRSHGAGLVGRPAAAEPLGVEVEIFLRILHARGDRDLGRFHRALAQHRKLLQHDLQLGIVLHEVEHVGHRALAVTAIVVEELDEGDVAVLVAERHAARRVEDRIRVLRDHRLMLGLVCGRLAFGQFVHRLLEDLGVADEVVPDDAFDVALLGVVEALGRGGPAAQRERDQGRGERVKRICRSFLRESRCPEIRRAT